MAPVTVDSVAPDMVVKALAEAPMEVETVTAMVDTAKVMEDTTAVSTTSQCHIRVSPTMANSMAPILVLDIVAIQVMALLITVVTMQEPMITVTVVDTVAMVVTAAMVEVTVATVVTVVTLASVATLQQETEATVAPLVAATVAMAPLDSQADMFTTDIPVGTTSQALSDTHLVQD